MPMRCLLAVILALTAVPFAAAQYPKTLTQTVTRITRTKKTSPACDNCSTEIKVEAHTTEVNFVLTCTEEVFPDHPENNFVCAQFETGIYQATRVGPKLISFWGDPAPKRAAFYNVSMEETRTKQ